MKQAIVPALAFSLVTLAGFLVWELTLADSRSKASLSTIEELVAASNRNSDSIAALHLELQEIRNQLVRSNRLTETVRDEDKKSQSSDLTARIEMVEDAIEQLSSSHADLSKRSSEDVNTQSRNRLQEPTDMSAYRQSLVSENDFENDSGIPLGDYADSIGDTLHALESIEVQNMDCRDTICKVTYSTTAALAEQEIPDVEFELVDKLAQGMEERGVEVRYASDSYGNEVMYIQLH